jgi:3-oxoacyl-[acyl-carrier-protein] synthase II
VEVFINGTGLLSPQATFDEASFSLSTMKAADSNRLKCLEPDYKNFINPASSRRMSRMIKMGITSAKLCLTNAAVENPGAIITGTGLGCIEDTEKFIVSILENNEQLLTPTPFIQSTHNTVGGQIALLLHCHEYNFTYVHRGISFESALLDAAMLIEEQSADNILVGGIDELTDHSFTLLQELGIYSRKENIASNLSDGTPGGEGAAFFLLSGKKTEKSIAKISSLKTLVGVTDTKIISEKITGCLAEAGKTIQDVALVLTGDSGHPKTDGIYQELRNGIFKNSVTKTFKQYCGEYHTASSFALWMAAAFIGDKKNHPSTPSSIFIYNNFGGVDHIFILLEKC